MTNRRPCCNATLAVCVLLALTATLMVSTTVSAQTETIGKITYVKGAVSAKGVDGKIRIVGKNDPLHRKDILITGPDSFVVFETTDGTRMSVRPNSSFSVEEYAHGSGEESALMRLFQGGVRAVTGFISKRNPESGIQLKTPTALVGVRGTEFDARLCEGDCGEDTTGVEEPEVLATYPAVGRVVELQGAVTAEDPDGETRPVQPGGPVYKGDVLEASSAGYAVAVFRDGSRVTLPGGSRFAVEAYDYQEQKEEGGAFFRLLRGGLRVLSGVLGKDEARGLKVGAATAVVGVRGTAFDVRLCEGDCPQDSGGGAGESIAARVVQVENRVWIASPDGSRKVAKEKDPVRTGDVLETGPKGVAVLVFRDDSRVTLQPGSRFQVEDYNYSTGDDGVSLFRLIRGGIRAVTGFMAQRNPGAFRIRTPTGVVGVRGSQIEMFWLDDTSNLSPELLQALGIDPDQPRGLILLVRGGVGSLQNQAGTFLFQAGQAAFFAGAGSEPLSVPGAAALLIFSPFPAPETVPADLMELFGQAGGAGQKLYVSVRDGSVVFSTEGGREVVVPAGAAAVLTGWSTLPMLLPQVPVFLLEMPGPLPESIPVDMKSLFGAATSEGQGAGLYVSVYDGHVVLVNAAGELHLGKGEGGFANPDQTLLLRLVRPPDFQLRDPIPSPKQLEDWIKRFESGLDTGAGGEGGADCQCEIVF